MISDLDLSSPPLLDGVTDTQITTGAVYEVDVPGRSVRVGLPGDVALLLPALPGRYDTGSGLARVLLGPSGRPTHVLGPVNPLPPTRLATVASTSGTTVTVTWLGVATPLPAIPATYTIGQTAWVSTDDWGQPYLVLGPSTTPPPAAVPPPTPPPSGGTVPVEQVIFPQWSGTWRSSRAAWDRWNLDRYGGRSTLYQGDGFGSGPLKGLATYGTQITNLGATSIDRVRVMLRGVGLSGASGPATVQGSPHGSQPAGSPSSSGSTATGDGWTDLPADVRAGMLSGAVRGLCLVGPQYWAVAGTSGPDGMALIVNYTRPI